MARTKQNKGIKFNFNALDSIKASAGGGLTALSWEGLDMIPKIKEKPMVAPLITLGIGIIAGGINDIQPIGFGMQGASSCELIGQMIEKIKEKKATGVGKSMTLNGRLTEALENSDFREKFQSMMKQNPEFRTAVTRRLEREEENEVCDNLENANDKANELFNLALAS